MAATLALSAVAGLSAWLGVWQLERAAEKQSLQQRFANAPLAGKLDPRRPAAPYTRVSLNGTFDPRRHILADNRTHQGRTGVHVLTPFRPDDGTAIVLVNRGWLPMRADRATLPAVPGAPGPVRISGHLGPLRTTGPRLGDADVLRPDRWPQLVTYPDLGAIQAALDTPLYPLVLYLHPDSPGGFGDRQWKPFTMGPDKHRGYAIQWFALGIAAAVTWLAAGLSRGRKAAA